MATYAAEGYVEEGYVALGYVQRGIRVDWPSRTIVIPRGDLTLRQTTPVEVRELDLNVFRLILKDLEDEEDGMIFPTTHSHNPPVAVGGVTLARVVELINDYTVTFEDGQYAVNLVGANSNVADRVNVNQVSVRAANSAGLVQTDEIEASSYGGGISFSFTAGETGTAYPIGTPSRPVNNLADVFLIQGLKALPRTLFIDGFTNFNSSDVLTDWTLKGNSNWNDHSHTFSGGIFTDCSLDTVHVAGTYYGLTTANNCRIGSPTMAGDLIDCAMSGNLSLNGDTEIVSSRSAITSGTPPSVNCVGLYNLQVRGYVGSLEIRGVSDAGQYVSIDILSGTITIDSTCTAGTIVVRGSGELIDNSAGATIVSTGLSADALHHASFDGGVTLDVTNGTPGTAYPLGTGRAPVNNIQDALSIANARGFKAMYIRGHLTLTAADNVGGFHMHGEGASLNVSKTIVTLEPGAGTSSTHWYQCRITGKQGGESFYHKCMIDEIWNAHCFYEECGLITPSVGTFTVQQSSGPSAAHTTYLTSCYSDEGVAVIDRTGVKESQRYSDWHGNIKFINQNNPSVGPIWIHISGGSVEIDSTCTEGIFYITGDGEIINNTGGAVVKTGILQKIDDARIAVESLRPTHQGYGDILYVDPVNGNDSNEGETQFTSVKTFARAHDLVVDGRNDVIQFINPSASGFTHNEDMLCTKNNVHIRATSRDITFKPSTVGGTVLTVGDYSGLNGYNCSVTGLLLDGDKAGAIPGDYCMQVNGKFCALNYVWAKQAALDCIQFRGGDYHTILDGEIEKAGRHGVSTFDAGLPSGSPREITIFGRSNIYLNSGDGINLGATTGNIGSTTRIIRILSGDISLNGVYGINAAADVDNLVVSSSVMVHDNTVGDYNILTPEYFNEKDELLSDIGTVPVVIDEESIAATVWAHVKALTVAKFIGLK